MKMILSDNQETNNNLSTPSTIVQYDKSRIHLKTDKPGNTLLISELIKTVTDSELTALFSNYGTVSQVLISKNGFALIDFLNINTTSELVYNSKIAPFKIASHTVRLSFSSQTVDEYKSLSSPNLSRSCATKVLHFLITNLMYSINVEVLHKICSPHGKIVRIYIGKKNLQENSIEALIEFLTDADAKNVKDSLDGNDIYSNCCSLAVNYSKIHKIFVEKNDSESFDYCVVLKAGLLGPPPLPSADSPGGGDNNDCNNSPAYLPMTYGPPPIFSTPPMFPPAFSYSSFQTPIYERKPQSGAFLFYKTDATVQETVEGVVVQCRNFSSKLTSDNLFNLFCLYGNVEKVKMMKDNGNSKSSNENSKTVAFVQMANREGANFAIEMLNGMRIFKKTLEIVPTSLRELTDSSPNCDPIQSYFSDFNNRFKTSFQGKSRVFFPSQTLHFFNVPSNFRAEEIADVFVSAKVKDPSQVVIFPRKSGAHLRGSLVTGLIEFDSVEEAVEGVLMVNHTRLLLPQVSHPFHIKLAFSPAKISEQHIKSTSENDRSSKRGSSDGGDGGSGDVKSARMN